MVIVTRFQDLPGVTQVIGPFDVDDVSNHADEWLTKNGWEYRGGLEWTKKDPLTQKVLVTTTKELTDPKYYRG